MHKLDYGPQNIHKSCGYSADMIKKTPGSSMQILQLQGTTVGNSCSFDDFGFGLEEVFAATLGLSRLVGKPDPAGWNGVLRLRLLSIGLVSYLG